MRVESTEGNDEVSDKVPDKASDWRWRNFYPLIGEIYLDLVRLGWMAMASGPVRRDGISDKVGDKGDAKGARVAVVAVRQKNSPVVQQGATSR